MHLVDKHYGLEKDFPICRAFQMKILNDDFNSVNKLKINENMPRALSPNSYGIINERDYSSLSRNRNFEKYDLNDFMKKLEERNPAQPEFIQATREQEKL